MPNLQDFVRHGRMVGADRSHSLNDLGQSLKVPIPPTRLGKSSRDGVKQKNTTREGPNNVYDTDTASLDETITDSAELQRVVGLDQAQPPNAFQVEQATEDTSGDDDGMAD